MTTTLQIIALLGAGVRLLTMIRMVQKDRPRNVTALVTACVHHFVVGTVAFPITLALCVILVPASWLIVIPFRAFKLFVRLGISIFRSVRAGQVQQQRQQSDSSAACADVKSTKCVLNIETALSQISGIEASNI